MTEAEQSDKRLIAIKVVDVYGNEHMTVYETDRYPDESSKMVLVSSRSAPGSE